MKRYSWIAALLVVALAFVLFGCGGEAPYREKPLYDHNVLMITAIDNWAGLDIVGPLKADGTKQKGGVKFGVGDEIYIEFKVLVDVEQLFLQDPRETAWTEQEVAQIKYQPVIGETYKETIELTQAQSTKLTTDVNTPSYAADTDHNGRVRGNAAGGCFIIEELTYSIGGAVEVFALTELLEDLEPGVIEAEDFDKISTFIQAAGGEGNIILEILGPPKN